MIRLLYILMISFCFSCTKEGQPTADLPLITASDAEVRLSTNADKMVFTLSISGQNTGGISLKYSTFDGTAKAGIDYVAVNNQTISFAANETEKQIEISLIDSDTPSPNKQFSLILSDVQNALLQRDRANGTLINDNIAVPTEGFISPASYSGYTLTWSDEFQGTELSADWTHEIGNSGWGNNELQYYRPENTFMANGEYLVIEARKEDFQGAPYTSSRIITKDRKFFQYGRVDIRATLPKGQGIWPALWMLGQNFSTVGWPACGEIDIMEIIGSEPNKLHGTVHWDNNGQYANFGGSTTLASGDFSDKFHVFSIIWDAQQIRWLLDDVQYHAIDITPAALSEFRADYFFIFNVAVGGNWPGYPDATTVFPQRMIVDYIRVFQ